MKGFLEYFISYEPIHLFILYVVFTQEEGIDYNQIAIGDLLGAASNALRNYIKNQSKVQ